MWISVLVKMFNLPRSFFVHAHSCLPILSTYLPIGAISTESVRESQGADKLEKLISSERRIIT